MDLIYAFVLGFVEGLTEFLPISSTGHMILTTKILNLDLDEFWRSFLIVVQLGSIMAVIFVFWHKLSQSLDIWLKLAVGFFPTGVLGLLLSPYLYILFNAFVVVFMLIFGGLIFILIEKTHKNKSYQTNSLEELRFTQVFCIGLFQSLAMFPGTSRSGATIIGGLLLGLNRKVATEFSFLLALPTMIIASLYSVYKNPSIISIDNAILLGLGFVTAFIVAILVIKLFLRFIARFNFVPFGIYRIMLGLLFLALFNFNIVDISEFAN